jgi:hypothetical protein
MSPLTEAVDLFEVDVLPPRCSVEAIVRMDPAGDNVDAVRFRAQRPAGRWRRQQQSDWSGWFAYRGEPIMLRWDTFWPAADGGTPA